MLGTDDTAADNAGTSLLYAGEQYDSDLSQYYLRARYYNPWSGSFNRTDPFAGNNQDPQSLHKYLYCHNNPVNDVDPTGNYPVGRAIGLLTIASVIGILIGLMWGYPHFQSTVRSFDRTVPVRISIGQDFRSGLWNTKEIERHLKNIMKPCFDHIASPGSAVKLELVEEPVLSGQLGWTVENGVRLKWNGRINFVENTLGQAYSPGTGNSYFEVDEIENTFRDLGGGNIDIYYANFVAHEQFWLSICDFGLLPFNFDRWGAPAGEISSGKIPPTDSYLRISESSCREILNELQLGHR